MINNAIVRKASSPLSDTAVSPRHWGFNVDGVVAQPSELQGLIQRANHEQSIMAIWADTHKKRETLRHMCSEENVWVVSWEYASSV